MERLFDEKTLLITDVDLDGAGSKIIMNFLYPEAEVLIAERNEVDKAVIESIYSGKYNKIIMTDCSMKNWETVNMVNEFIWNGNQFYLLDHHVSASWLNEQHWADVIIEKDMTLMCGTRLFYDWIIGENEKKNKEFADYIKNHFGEFVELVRLYDTWDWKRTNDMDAYNLSRLFDFKGRDEFCKDIISNLGPNKKLISEKILLSVKFLKSMRWII